MRREMICVLEEAKCSCNFEDVRNKLDLLNSQVQNQAKLESKCSKTLQATLRSISTDEGIYGSSYLIMCIAKSYYFTDDQNVQDENTFILLNLLLKPKAKDKMFHQLSVSYNTSTLPHVHIHNYMYGLVR